MIDFIWCWLLIGTIVALSIELTTEDTHKTNESRIKLIFVGPILLIAFIVGFIIGWFRDVRTWFEDDDNDDEFYS